MTSTLASLTQTTPASGEDARSINFVAPVWKTPAQQTGWLTGGTDSAEYNDPNDMGKTYNLTGKKPTRSRLVLDYDLAVANEGDTAVHFFDVISTIDGLLATELTYQLGENVLGEKWFIVDYNFDIVDIAYGVDLLAPEYKQGITPQKMRLTLMLVTGALDLEKASVYSAAGEPF